MNFQESTEQFIKALENQGTKRISDPTRIWEILDLATDHLRDTSPAGQYARRMIHVLPETDQTDLGKNGELDSEHITKKVRNTKTAKAAAALCARHGIPTEGRCGRNHSTTTINALGECLSADDADIRAWSAKAFDYTYEFDPDPVAEQLLEASEDSDPRVRAAAIGALCHDIWRQEPITDWADSAMATLADGFIDDARIVRTRAASIVESPELLIETKLWGSHVDPETRARVVRNATNLDVSETATDESWIIHPAKVMADLCFDEVWEHLEEYPEFE
ncbi:HEAT repeat domain-containing protein [Halorussus lipolyticus]|uniref:HEAT repeat domain-containing protein n=1 Tax=Halorussus lipolyticus TaxID=3034024 RepID=UPI0023E7CE9B|nr:HEAT repeat domain-containing protein [Halorussus sp. DT80]